MSATNRGARDDGDEESVVDRMSRFGATAKWLSLAVVALVGVLIIGTIGGTFFTVTEQERVVVTSFSKLSRVATPGLELKWPWLQGTASYRIDVQQVNLQKLNTYTVDSQEVDVNVGIQFRLPPNEVAWVFVNVPDYKERLKEIAIDRLKQVMGKVQLTEFAKSRQAAVHESLLLIRQDVKALLHIDVTDFQILDASFTDTFRKGIDAATTAKANVEKAAQDKQAAQIDAERAKIKATGEADATREVARGKADGVELEAKANAAKIKLEGDAQAQAITAQVSALASAGPSYVNLEMVRKWGGEVPMTVLGQAPATLLNLPAADPIRPATR